MTCIGPTPASNCSALPAVLGCGERGNGAYVCGDGSSLKRRFEPRNRAAKAYFGSKFGVIDRELNHLLRSDPRMPSSHKEVGYAHSHPRSPGSSPHRP